MIKTRYTSIILVMENQVVDTALRKIIAFSLNENIKRICLFEESYSEKNSY